MYVSKYSSVKDWQNYYSTPEKDSDLNYLQSKTYKIVL